MARRAAHATEFRTSSRRPRLEGAEGDVAPALRYDPAVPSAWQDVLGAIGLGSATATGCIATLSELFSKHTNAAWLVLWREHCASYFDLTGADGLLDGHVPTPDGTRLFFVQAYCRLLLATLSRRCGFDVVDQETPGLFDWAALLPAKAAAALEDEISSHLPPTATTSLDRAINFSNFLSYAYQEILPPEIRHLTGEYYTPRWLVDYVLDSLPHSIGDPSRKLRVLDPSAGSGAFLAHCIERLSAVRPSKGLHVIAVDVNPVAVEFCKVNLAVARALQKDASRIDCSTILADAILDPIEPPSAGPSFGATGLPAKIVLGHTFIAGEDWLPSLHAVCTQYNLSGAARARLAATLRAYLANSFSVVDSLRADLVVGNPPWMTWDAVRSEYRDKLARQWHTSTLITQKGWRARVAAGKTDISSLFVYRAAERHAAPNAAMAFVLPLSLFQSRHAGAGFRRFRSVNGRPYRLTTLDDFSDVKIFPDAANRAAVATFSVDRPARYPARFAEWSNSAIKGHLTRVVRSCMPIDAGDPTSPIIPLSSTAAGALRGVSKSDYRARGGVNTGGANTILWIEPLKKDGDLVQIRNVGMSRRTASAVHQGWVESAVVHPLLVGTDVARWSAKPSKHIFLMYSEDQPKKAMSETAASLRHPKALDFISLFRDHLSGRKEYRRWGGTGPFYEVYRIGPYTFSPIKVVWQHTGFRDRLRVAVLDDRCGVPTIPDQKVILIPSDDIDEAHYICAYLGSTFVSATLSKYLGVDASTHILDYVGLKTFSKHDQRHARLAELSRAAHHAVRSGLSPVAFEQEIDRLTERLHGECSSARGHAG
jgi:methylase of polypeptide subunit release factors